MRLAAAWKRPHYKGCLMASYDQQVVAFAEERRFLAGTNAGYVESLVLSSPEIHDRDLRILAAGPLPRLTRLEIWDTSISDEGLRHLAGLSRLESLDISETAIDGSGFQHLTCEYLKSLRLRRCKNFGLRGAKKLARFLQLQDLWLDGTAIDDDCLVELRPLQQLVTLKLGETRITDRAIESLSELKALRTVGARRTAITEEGMKRLRAKLPHLSRNLYI